jgi:hypothetical protein
MLLRTFMSLVLARVSPAEPADEKSDLRRLFFDP